MSLENILGLDNKLVMKFNIENNISCEKINDFFLVEWGWTKKLLTMNPMERQIEKITQH